MPILNYEEAYRQLVDHILREGEMRKTRNAPTRSVFGTTMVIDSLSFDRFPVLTGRHLYTSGVFGELSAFFNNPKSVKDFEAHGCNYWKQWAKANGELVLDYGNSWTDFHGVNQLDELVKSLINDPNGRRHIVTGWDPSRLPQLDLPCCHLLYQWYVTGDGELEMIWYQRSVDVMVGLPSDVILAAAWNIIVAHKCGYVPGKITFMMGDTHIYESHVLEAIRYLDSPQLDDGATYIYSPVKEFADFTNDSIQLINYVSRDKFTFEVHA